MRLRCASRTVRGDNSLEGGTCGVFWRRAFHILCTVSRLINLALAWRRFITAEKARPCRGSCSCLPAQSSVVWSSVTPRGRCSNGGAGFRRRNRRSEASMLLVLLLPLWQQVQRLPNKPPVTLALVAGRRLRAPFTALETEGTARTCIVNGTNAEPRAAIERDVLMLFFSMRRRSVRPMVCSDRRRLHGCVCQRSDGRLVHPAGGLVPVGAAHCTGVPAAPPGAGSVRPALSHHRILLRP